MADVCKVSKKRIKQLEAKKRKAGPIRKAWLEGRIKIQKRFQIRACGRRKKK